MKNISFCLEMAYGKKSYLLAAMAAAILLSCSSAGDYNTMDVDELYKAGMERYHDEDWLEAQKVFDLIKLQHPSSQYADDAQYYMAETYYRQNKFILAAYNYNSVRRYYPMSEYSKMSLFKNGMCYVELSLPFDRDQDYTEKAISSFMEFKYAYPKDSLAAEADSIIKEMRNKLGHRAFFTADLYRKLYAPESALIYYDIVINEYADTDYYQQAYVGKIEVLIELRRYDDALGIAQLYKVKFPEGDFASEISALEQSALTLKNQTENTE